MNVVDEALVYLALREAASYTRIEVRKKAYLELAERLRRERLETNEQKRRDRNGDVEPGALPRHGGG